MTEQKKLEYVIQGLKTIMAFVDYECATIDSRIVRDVVVGALDLLKAQEPVKPTIDIRHGKSMWRCGSCATALQPNQIHTKFCFNCGKAVMWGVQREQETKREESTISRSAAESGISARRRKELQVMTDVQKMLEALECHFKPLGEENCSECQYECRGATFTKVQHRLCMDLVEFLKEQQPKVIALQDIHRGMAVWLEDIDKEDVILAIGGASCGGAKCFITENDMSIAVEDAEYNKRWRAWTKEPTKEQRKVAKWDA